MSSRYFDPDEEQAFEQMNAELRRAQEYRRQADPLTARNVQRIRAYAPWMPYGTTYALAAGGHDDTSEETKVAADAAAKRKTRKGLGWHSIGDLVTATADTVADVARPVVRAGFTVLQSGAQAVDRTVAANVEAVQEKGVLGWATSGVSGTRDEGEPTILSATSAGLALKDLREGRRVDLGSGYLPGGEIAKREVEVARRFGTVDGHAITPGRLLATTVFEPGTKPYNVLSGLTDAAVDIGLDPAELGLRAVSQARKAAKLFDPPSAGLVDGTRKTVLSENAEQWLAGGGRRVVDYLATETNLNRMRRAVKGKVPVDVLRGLTDATTADEVRDVLAPVLGIAVRSKDQLTPGVIARFAPEFRKRLDGVRLLQQMPGGHVDLNDLDDVVERMDRFMRNAKLDGELIDERIDRLARTTDRIDRYKVVTEVLEDTLTKVGGFTDKTTARKLTTMFTNYNDELAKYFVDEIGNNVPIFGTTIGGTGVTLPSPHLFSEYVDRALPLPDARAIRRVTSRYGRLLNKPGLDLGVATLDFLQQQMWKPMVLIRGAWTFRVIGEEQVRMGASGHDSMFRHPLSYIAWVTGRRGGTGVTGEHFADASAAAADVDEFAKAMSRMGGGWRDRVVVPGKRRVPKGDPGYARSLADELLQLRSDPLAERMAGGWRAGDNVPGGLTGNHVEDAKRWFWEGPGQKFRDEMARAEGRDALLVKSRPDGTSYLDDGQVLSADDYVDSVFRRLQTKTGEDTRLMEAVATGRMEGVPIRDGLTASKGFATRLGELVEAEDIGPAFAKGDITLAARGTAGSKVAELLDRAVDVMFDTLMSRPTNWLSRSPEFRQAYWQRIEELLPGLDSSAQEAAVLAAKEANLPRATLQRLAKRALKGSGDLSLDDADLVAKGFGLDSTKHLLYDLTERGQFFDVNRIVFPFGEAWKEVATRWVKIGTENPQVIRRGQQIVEGARGAGFFYTDETTGEEMFLYPGTGMITEKLIGVPVPMAGRVQGLNIFAGTVLPGFGLAVTIPAGALLPDKPEWDSVRNIIMPFGELDTEGGIVESVLPAWLQKFRQAGATPFGHQDDRMWNNTVMDVMRYLVSTGEYSTSTVEGQEKLLADAKDKARLVYAFRGAVQFFAPSAPSPRFLAMDKDGNLMLAQKLVEEFSALSEEDWETAPQRFLERFGDGALLFMQGKTEGVAQPTKAVSDWQRDHPEIARRYPEVYGYFAPQGGDFDIDAYSRQLARGERKPITPEEAVRRANARVAGMVYRQAKQSTGDRKDEAAVAWLRSVKEALTEEYPGYDPGSFDPGTVDRRIRQVEQALKEEAVASTDAGEGARLYLMAREKAEATAEASGLATFARAKSARGTRDWLRAVALAVAEEHPDFAPLWERVFEPELADDADTLEEAA